MPLTLRKFFFFFFLRKFLKIAKLLHRREAGATEPVPSGSGSVSYCDLRYF